GDLASGQLLPLLVQPTIENINPIAWASSNRAFVEDQLLKHGAILFRNFKVDSLSKFERLAQTLSSGLTSYAERSSPRTKLEGAIYTSTDHPADQYIHLHNEQSYTLNWPMKIWFHCIQPAHKGGRTPIADS